MILLITQIRAVAGGEEAEITLDISDGKGNSQTIRGKISAAMLSELKLPSYVREPLSIERDRCETLLRMMKLYSALKKGVLLLGYASGTKKSLKSKLIQRGYPIDIAEEAAEKLARMGLIHEKDDAMLFAENLANRKLYGKNRIKKELYAKGFEADVIGETIDALEADFAAICAKRIRSLGGLSVFETAELRKKTVAALLRYGFSYGEIHEAKSLLQDEEN